MTTDIYNQLYDHIKQPYSFVLSKMEAFHKVELTKVSDISHYMSNSEWKYIGTQTGCQLFVKSVPGTDLLAFRGVASLDLHISEIIGPFSNISLSYDWIDMLKHIEAFPFSASEKHDTSKNYYFTRSHDIVYQIIGLPWPLKSRELVLRRDWIFDEISKSITFHYESIDDNRFPLTEKYIRAISPHTLWKFTAIENENNEHNEHTTPNKLTSFLQKLKSWDSNVKRFFQQLIKKDKGIVEQINFKGTSKTKVEIECLVDSKGSIPAWFLNYMQRSWPAKTIGIFEQVARKQLQQSNELYEFEKISKW